ncbi:2-hydroxyacid dehydrogenase [Pontiella sulfatireligans]|uniref:D-lactate dehydrogenase n=1 Tax=Pontiella sulfatireligans TaxID=2750658 RepID=A0A6C2UQK5_9BACT|nr:2-hydroxyacid dehydrogenase [Pontiella sulfatireligans]VGO21584.1 D-lactate dehydrogenase [Pontiella sulfatireligans]
MKIAFFSTKPYDRKFFDLANKEYGHEITYYEGKLRRETLKLAEGYDCACVFVNDQVDASVLIALAAQGTRLVALRCAGFNNVDIVSAKELGINVVRVPAYSPYAVAEHTVGLMLALNRKVYWAHSRVREGNFSLDGLLGFDMRGRTAGIIGTGKIGECVIRILNGFGCKVIAYDKFKNPACEELGVEYVELDELFAQSDIVSLHCPLFKETHHLINNDSIAKMKKGVMIINTSRGALIDSKAAIEGLKSEKIGYLGIDVYEEEGRIFFEDKTFEILTDDVFARLTTFPNVVITGHQAYFTQEAVAAIAKTTLENISAYENGDELVNAVKVD